MLHRKEILAVAVLFAGAGIAMADTTALSLTPTVTADDAAAPRGLLMAGLDQIGAGKTLDACGLNIYGWVEAGYTYNHRHHSENDAIQPGPFNHEVGNHFMGNQLDLRIERLVDLKKWDVGGLVEIMYGTDSNAIHATGLGYDGDDPTTTPNPNEDRYHPEFQFDIVQAYIDVAVPVGNGLQIRGGKFVTLLGYESIAATANPFYSHSWIFNFEPFTQTGLLAFYKINPQWSVIAGVTRGWDICLEDRPCQIDFTGRITYLPVKNVDINLNWSVGPENQGDADHYRTVIDPVIHWQVSDKLSLGAEGMYYYDGGVHADPGFQTPFGQVGGNPHTYGDRWGMAFYAGYKINDMFTINGRGEWLHVYGVNGLAALSTHIYEITLGTTITPFPKDKIGSNLKFRPEIRYDFSEDKIFSAGGREFKDQLTFGCDVILTF